VFIGPWTCQCLDLRPASIHHRRRPPWRPLPAAFLSNRCLVHCHQGFLRKWLHSSDDSVKLQYGSQFMLIYSAKTCYCGALLRGVIAGRYCGGYCGALMRAVIAGRYCGALMLGVIAGRYCGALLRGVNAGSYCGALLRGVIALYFKIFQMN
jgi:hypothetical protein